MKGKNGLLLSSYQLMEKFLYASNRAHNSIAVFEVIADGSLKLIEIVPTGGLNPRDFTLSPDQHYLIAAHQDSPNATVFKS